MKIAAWHNLPSGGGKRALYDHLHGLSDRGHIIETFCPDTASADYLRLDAFGAVHRLPLPDKGPHVRWCNRLFSSDRLRRLRQMLWHCQEVAEGINSSDCDVVFVNSCLFFNMSLLSLFLRKPCLIYLNEPHRWHHEALPDNPWLLGEFCGKAIVRPAFWLGFMKDARLAFQKRLQITYEIESARAYDRILVNSSFSRESVLRAYGIESQVCYLGIDSKKFCPSSTDKGDYVISVGFLGYTKGTDRVVRALARIPGHIRPALHWICNGEDPSYRAAIEKLARERGVSLRILGCLSDEGLVRQLQEAVAMIYAPRLEPFGLAPLEANACGTPVIGIAEGGIRETVEDGINGILVTDALPGSLADAIEALVTNPPMQKRLSQQAIDYVQGRWSMGPSIDRVELHLSQVARGVSNDSICQ
jgi:glycosyltransferase involved in cell wall biosynthesis